MGGASHSSVIHVVWLWPLCMPIGCQQIVYHVSHGASIDFKKCLFCNMYSYTKCREILWKIHCYLIFVPKLEGQFEKYQYSHRDSHTEVHDCCAPSVTVVVCGKTTIGQSKLVFLETGVCVLSSDKLEDKKQRLGNLPKTKTWFV